MNPIITTALRGVQAFFALVVLGLGAYVANWYNTQTLTTAPIEINFMIFVPIFALLAVVYLEAVPRFMPRASHPWANTIVEATATLFWIGGVLSLGIFLSRLLFCRGPVCAAAKATAAIGGLQMGLWGATLFFTARKHFMPGSRKGGVRPAMKEMV